MQMAVCNKVSKMVFYYCQRSNVLNDPATIRIIWLSIYRLETDLVCLLHTSSRSPAITTNYSKNLKYIHDIFFIYTLFANQIVLMMLLIVIQLVWTLFQVFYFIVLKLCCLVFFIYYTDRISELASRLLRKWE